MRKHLKGLANVACRAERTAEAALAWSKDSRCPNPDVVRASAVKYMEVSQILWEAANFLNDMNGNPLWAGAMVATLDRQLPAQRRR